MKKLNGNFKYIETQKDLEEAYREWREQDLIAIDLECENNLHHYGLKISLIQISTRNKHYIVDLIRLKEVKLLVMMLEDPCIRKIFHDVNFDFEVLDYELKCKPSNVFDTQVAALFTGKKEIGLGSLLELYFGVKKEKKFQKADWTKRPLKKDMLSYAINDTTYLIKLHDILIKELKEMDRYNWVMEEMGEIEKKKYKHKKSTFLDLKGLRDLTPYQLAILRRLFILREKLAKKVNRPVHFVISNKILISLVKKNLNLNTWKNLKGVHPVVRKSADLFNQSVIKSKGETVKLPQKKGKRFSEKQKKDMNELLKMREKSALKVNLAPHLIMNKEQMQKIVINGNNNILKKWQKKVLIG